MLTQRNCVIKKEILYKKDGIFDYCLLNNENLRPMHKLDKRPKMMGFLVRLHKETGNICETLHSAINIFNRVCDAPESSLEIVAMASLLIASKYEEVYPVDTVKLLKICDITTKETLRNYEMYILKKLDGDLSFQPPLHFLRRISIIDGLSDSIRRTARFFCEVCVYDERLSCLNPALTAAGSYHLSRILFKKDAFVSD